MQIHHSISSFNLTEKPTVVTLGTFDGVHVGHKTIIDRLITVAEQKNEESVILTFHPHPRIVLQKGSNIKLLTVLEEKKELLHKTGIDHLIIEPFTEAFSRLTAVDFVRDILVNKLHLNTLVIGYDHHFGRNREGNFEQLEELSKLYGFDVIEIPAKDIKNIAVSSTKIRNALNEGNIVKANNYLGYNYLLTGEIIHGKGLGQQYNYPTVNIKIDYKGKLIPKAGVYIVKTNIDKKTVFGIMNIGFRPTIDGKQQTIEVHLLDFNGNLYGKIIQVAVLYRLRDEQKFKNLETLFSQIKNDEAKARELLQQNIVK